MKPAQILIFTIILIAGGIIIFRSFGNNTVSSATNYSNPAKVLDAVSSTEVPEPTSIYPTETPIITSPTPTQTSAKTITKVQIIKATYGPPLGFYPSELTVKAGIPVRLEVYADESGRGCMGSIMLPELLPNNIQGFTKGQTNIFEFTPQTPGTYSITCAMGIPHGNIIVE